MAREEQERLEQLRLEQEVEQQGLEGSLRVAEQAREALEDQLPTLRQERCRLQEQLAQVGVRGWGAMGAGGKELQAPASRILSWRNSRAWEPDSGFKSSPPFASWEPWAGYATSRCLSCPVCNVRLVVLFFFF